MAWNPQGSNKTQWQSTGRISWQQNAEKKPSAWHHGKTWQNQSAPQVRPNTSSESVPSSTTTAKLPKIGGGILSQTLVVSCRGPGAEDVVIRSLVGEYQEQGSNHSRKVYKKSTETGKESVDVFLYYWDSRDGPNFQGWWFGNMLGGTQVWSHNASDGVMPPASGWKIPWDGAVRPALTVSPKTATTLMDAQEKLKAVNQIVNDATVEANTALEQARALAADFTDSEALQQAEQLLAPQGLAIGEALKRLMEARKPASGETAKQLTQMSMQLRTMQQTINAEKANIYAMKNKAEAASKQKEAAQKELQAFHVILPEAEQKTNVAEDCVEKALITSEMIASAGEDMDEGKSAVEQTEQAVQEAQKAIGEARIFLNAKQASARRFETEGARKEANNELSRLQNSLQEAQNKLNPLKTVRQDFAQRIAAQKLAEEVLEKLTPTEIEVDRAEEAAMILSSDSLSKELMQQSEQTVAKASAHVESVLKFIEQKKRASVGIPREELSKLEDRARGSQRRLAEIKGAQKEATERVTCDLILKEAAEKVQVVSEAILKAADAEGPFLMGVEVLPLEETLSAIKTCEATETSAKTSVSIARMFLATKLVEAKRFSKGPSAEATTKLKECQEQLEVHTKKLNELKNSTLERKRKCLVREADAEVAKTEDLVKKVAETAEVFEDDERLFDLSAADIKKAAGIMQQAESAASISLAETRKFITARQIESKGKDVSTETGTLLVKYQTRLSTAETEVAKYKKLAASVETRLGLKKILDEASSRIAAAEDKITNVEQVVEEMVESKTEQEDGKDKEKGIDKLVKVAETASQEATAALKAATRYLEMQTRSSGPTKEAVQKIQPRVSKAQERLDAAVASMKERSEKTQVASILKESEQRVSEAEENVKKVAKAEEPLSGGDELSISDVTKALTELEAAITAANNSVGGSKTLLAMKRLAAKRLGDAAKANTTEALTALQARLDGAAKALTETKKGMAERKASTVRREVNGTVAEVEKLVDVAVEATASMADTGEMSPEEVKSACERAGTVHASAQTAIAEARELLLTRQRDAKTSSAEANVAMLADISKLIDQVAKLQATLDKQKTLLRDQEHKFVAKRLLDSTTAMIESLEKKLELTTATASPLADNPDSLTSLIFLTHIIDLLRQHIKVTKTSSKDLFDKLSEGKPGVSADQFVSFVTKLQDEAENKDFVFSEEQLKAAFARLLRDDTTEVPEAEFLDRLRNRYVVLTQVSMTDSLTVKGGKTIRKLEENELVEAMEDPIKEDNIGIMRLRAKAEKDDKEGYISLSGNQGTIYLEPHTVYDECRKHIEQVLQELGDSTQETIQYIDQKAEGLKPVRAGPLADTKAELLKMRPRVSKVQFAHVDLKKKVSSAQKQLAETMEVEKKKKQEAAEKHAAAETLADVGAAMNSLQAAVEKVLPAAESLAKSAGAEEEDAMKAFDAADKDLDVAIASVDDVATLIREKLEEIKGFVKGPLGELRASLVKQKVAASAIDSRCRKQAAALQNARKQFANDAHAAVVRALRLHAQKTDAAAEGVWQELSKGADEVSVEYLRSFLEKLADVKFKAGQLDLGLERYSAGLTKLSLLEILQEYLKCVKDIAMTSAFEVKEGKTVRKIGLDEVVEVLNPAEKDSGSGLSRVRCRALADGSSGWVTLKGNQGTPFLEVCPKPYLYCEADVRLSTSFETTSDEMQVVKQGEMFEVVEGPRQASPLIVKRFRGKAKKDGKAGWVTLKDASGIEYFEASQLLVCRQNVALTTTFDISEGKAVRKLDIGEMLEQIGEEQKDDKKNLSRVRAKTTSDQIEGWLTLKGNQGTAYAEQNENLFCCKKSTLMESRVASGSTALRSIEVGELFEMTDGPMVEAKERANRVKVRILSNGAEGWCTAVPNAVVPWTPQYTCVSSTVLHDGMEINDSSIVRKLEPGDLLKAMGTPRLNTDSGILRVRVRVEQDGKVGFASVKSNQGTVLLELVHDATATVAPQPPTSRPSGSKAGTRPPVDATMASRR
eukprot:TRINITY_DN5177_c0_g1_i5.p1 TRINITY_DN5177_c0_g1~~TRINITY_DN5177_c0_g1_i5.p1  ORF type:complete len:2021 (-),score=505.36 TRINITY_DN5177_c0_g1_i5:134-6160(-)